MLSPSDEKNAILTQYHACDALYNYAMSVKI
jgi:hypothetical protein